LSCVNCDSETDIQRLRNELLKIIPALNETELQEKMKSNFEFANKAVTDRIKLSEKEGFKVYADMVNKNIGFFQERVLDFLTFLAQVKDNKEKLMSLIQMVGISAITNWDEEQRIKDPTIVSFEVNVTDSVGVLELKYRELLLKVDDSLQLTVDREYKLNHSFWSHFYSKQQAFYTKVYIEADIEANKLSEDMRRKTLTVLNREMERLLYLFQLMKNIADDSTRTTPKFYEE